MSPKELRLFREKLGLSRREFGAKLFVSEPTIERWERGQGGPSRVHLQILKRMREHLGAGHSIAYFQYDAGEEAQKLLLPHAEKQMIVEILQYLGALLMAEKHSKDEKDWLLSFALGWAAGENLQMLMHVEGSERLERPMIDFTFETVVPCGDSEALASHLNHVCRNHSLYGAATPEENGRVLITLRHRLFTTGCNPETIKHVIGSLQSCWQRLKERAASPSAGVMLSQSGARET